MNADALWMRLGPRLAGTSLMRLPLSASVNALLDIDLNFEVGAGRASAVHETLMQVPRLHAVNVALSLDQADLNTIHNLLEADQP